MKIYNTLTRKKEEFQPISDSRVEMYVCGPTVYDYDHLGHARTFVVFDVIRRYFLSNGFSVKFIQNITDVGHLVFDAEEGEDKVERKAREEGKTPDEIAHFYTKEHFKDMKALNILKPTRSPHASCHIDEIINFISTLIKNGFAYISNGNVYFDVGKLPDYGRLSHRSLGSMKAGVRVKIDLSKRQPADFALWISDEKHLQKWVSPWGKGYPGWHIECSVLSTKYLGDEIDIHGSAIEHVFPHHENERAQNNARFGHEVVNFWVHSGMLNINGEKMAKSKGNFIRVRDALKKYDVNVIRLAFLMTHYRKPFDYKENTLKQAEEIIGKLLRAKDEAKVRKGDLAAIKKFNQAMEDDFNTPQGLRIWQEHSTDLDRDDFEYFERIFGLDLDIYQPPLSKEVEELIADREKARQAKDWTKADKIRHHLEEEGYVIDDTKEGPKVLKIK
jgi:cysteinyl-tRNA synthetase